MRVTVLYDFSSEIENELDIIAGEILTVTDPDVGNGWWEGMNTRGKRGIFPASYVEEIKSPVRPIAPIVPKTNTNSYYNNEPLASTPAADDPWATASPVIPPSYNNLQTQQSQQHRYDYSNEDNYEYDSDFDDDDTASRYNAPSNSQTGYTNVQLPPTPDDTQSIASSMAVARKSKMFSKSSDSYIMGTASITVDMRDQIQIFMNEQNLYFWKPIDENYIVTVTSPKMESKFKGIKKFIAYQLTPSFNNEPVSRRYKNFDWLHERLVEKFCLIPIPPLPDKQISGRYEEHFIEHRRAQLQEFVDWVCRHPVLSKCDVWMHFLTCKDQKKWKAGKRAAEKDPLQGSTFCAAIRVTPEKALLPSFVDTQIELCKNFTITMDGAVKMLESASADQSSKYTNIFKKDFQKIGDCFSELAKALDIDERRVTTGFSLSQSVGNTAGIFISIGKLYEEQAKRDWQPFCDKLHVYRGILNSFPDILSEHKNAQQKRKECEKLAFDQKMSNLQIQEVNRRVELMTISVLAEQSHFRQERDSHLKLTMKNLLEEQVAFYQTIVSKLQTAQRYFE
jgi:sorting nexin-9/18/33